MYAIRSYYGKQYRVYMQALPEDRADKSALDELYVKTSSGEMTPITQFVNLKRVYGPQSVARFNLYNSAKISGAANSGYSTGDAIAAVNQEIQKSAYKYELEIEERNNFV